MRKSIILISILVSFFSCSVNTNQEQDSFDSDNTTNDFYDNTETVKLAGSQIEVCGEVANPGIVDLSKLPLRSVIVKETKLKEGGIEFTGAYRYDGYSIHDILNRFKIEKKNKDAFRPIVDLYVEIENDKGEIVVLSWGELFYPVHKHDVILTTQVMHIIPIKTNEEWKLPKERKLVVASDLITARNISNPVKITVKSLERNFKVDRKIDPLFSEKLDIYESDNFIETVSGMENCTPIEYPNVFYGRGKGIHGTTPMIGFELKDLLSNYFQLTDENIKQGMITIASIDGYRSAFTFSEIYNRNDQSEVMIIDKDNYEKAGRYSLYVPGDFFSDRAMKAMSSIHFDIIKKVEN